MPRVDDRHKVRGLSGHQGVLLPAFNVQDLMLRCDFVDAATTGDFRIISIKTIDEGIEVFTGKMAGRRGRAGQFHADLGQRPLQSTIA